MTFTEVCAELRELAEASGWREIEVSVLADGRCALRAFTVEGYTAASVQCDVEPDSSDPSPDDALDRLRVWT